MEEFLVPGSNIIHEYHRRSRFSAVHRNDHQSDATVRRWSRGHVRQGRAGEREDFLVYPAWSIPQSQGTPFHIYIVDRPFHLMYHNVYQDFVVEPDASSASYPLALAAITGGEVTVD